MINNFQRAHEHDLWYVLSLLHINWQRKTCDATLEGGCRAGRALGGVAGLTRATSAKGSSATSTSLSSCLVKKVIERVPCSGALCTSESLTLHSAFCACAQLNQLNHLHSGSLADSCDCELLLHTPANKDEELHGWVS